MVMIPAGRVQLLDPHVGHRAGAHLLLRLRQVHKVKCWYNSTVQYSTVQYSTVQYRGLCRTGQVEDSLVVAEIFQKYLLRNNEPFLFYCRIPAYARYEECSLFIFLSTCIFNKLISLQQCSNTDASYPYHFSHKFSHFYFFVQCCKVIYLLPSSYASHVQCMIYYPSNIYLYLSV